MSKLNEVVDRLKIAAAGDDPDELTAACNRLAEQLEREPDTIAPDLARDALNALRKNRWFDHMGSLAEAFMSDGCEDAQVQRQYAQALIENRQIMPAIHMLDGVIADTATPVEEQADARGVLGRAWKERALAARGKRDHVAAKALRKAFQSYADVYRSDPDNQDHLYHGINAVALAAWDRGLVLTPEERKAALRSADAILDRIRTIEKTRRGNWALATAGEALVALGRETEAAGWFRDYAERADAFELGSTVRQLKELWKLDETEEGQELLGPLRARLLEKPGGRFAVNKDQIRQMASLDEASYEKVLGDTGPQTYRWMQNGFRTAESVALIRMEGSGMGTGFLVRGGDFNAELGDELFVLTNAHVVSDPPIGHAAHPSEVSVDFEAASAGAGSEYKVSEVVRQSSPDQHDASLLRLGADLRGKIEPIEFSSNLPRLDTDRRQRVYIIGHPGGGELSFSFQDNELLDYESASTDRDDDPTPRRIHYHTPTEPGSSGSPVFNGNWAAIALHHSGSKKMKKLNGKDGTYPANEGIWIESIRRAWAGNGLDRR